MQYAALQVIIPLVAAPICVIVYYPKLVWFIASIASWSCFLISFILLQEVNNNGVISYAMGGWSAPVGIEYRIDIFNAWVLFIICAISSVSLLFAYKSISKELPESRIFLFYAGWLLCLTGLLGITITGDAFNVFVFMEISSISSYLLISIANKPRALTATFNYLILGTIAGSFILIGIGLLYVMTGTLDMIGIHAGLEAVKSSNTIHTAFAFILIGTLLKAAIFPLHYWQPNAYAYAPTAVSMFLAGIGTKVSLYVLLRFIFTVFGNEYSFKMMSLDNILLPMAIAAMLIGSGVAIFQTNIKRMLAWSSIAQLGYIVLGIALLDTQGLTASMLHFFNHALIKTSLFMAVGCIVYRIGIANIDNIKGISKRMPYSSLAFIFGGLSLIGIPLSNGFISKWYLLVAAMQQQAIFAVIAIVFSSLLAIVYIWRIVELMYFGKLSTNHQTLKEAPPTLLLPTWLLLFASFYFGINPQFPLEITQNIAHTLLAYQ